MLIAIATKSSLKLNNNSYLSSKKTIMKHDTNKFNLTQFECGIKNLIYLLVNRKKLNMFFLLLLF